LGYYTRARNLHAAAKEIAHRFGGVIPGNVDQLRSLPGFGAYTANAVATFAFDRSVPAVDANIARVVSRLGNITAPIDTAGGRNELWTAAQQLVPKGNAGRFNSALMDLGATLCLPRHPQCGVCPVQRFCRASNPLALPVKRARPKLKRLREHHALTIRQDKILLQQCAQRWRGMWMLPAVKSAPKNRKPRHVSKFPFTNHQITLRVFSIPPNGTRPDQRWFPLRRLGSIPIPSPHRRAIDALLDRAATSRISG
jgi:A/G-specific adenine glycosylase